MNVRCDSCQTVYRVDPAKVPDQGIRARCAVCGHVFAVVTEAAPVGAGSSSVMAPASPVTEPAPTPEPAPEPSRPEAPYEPRTSDRVANSLGDAFIPVPEDEAPRRGGPGLDFAPPSAPPAPPEPEPEIEPPPTPPAAEPVARTAPPPTPEPVTEPAPMPAPEPPPAPAPEPPPVPSPEVASDAPTEPVPAVRLDPPAAEPPSVAPAPPDSQPPLRLEPTEPEEPAPEERPRVSRPFSLPRDIPTPSTESAPSAPRPTAPVFRPTPGMPPVQPQAAPTSPAPAGATPSPAPTAPAGGRKPVNPFLSRDPAQKARRLARALISDMIVYQPEKRQKALRDGNLKEVFDEEIQKSWEEYVEQVGREIADTTNHFNDALNDILAGGQKVF